MNNFINLVKINLREMVSFRKNKNDKKARNRLITLGIIAVIFLFLSIFYNAFFVYWFYSSNISIFYANILMSSFLTFMVFSTSIINIKNIFIGRDYDLLKAMPISKKDIVLSKTFSIYLVAFCYSFILLFPNMVISIIATSNMNYLWGVALEIVFVPVFPLFVSGMLSSLISYLASYFKKISTIIDIFFEVLIFVGFLVFQMFISLNTGSDINTIDVSTFDRLKWINPTSYFLEESIDNLMYVFLYAITNIILIFIFAFIIGKMFYRIHNALEYKKTNKVYIEKKYNNSHQFVSFFKNELKRFFKSKMMLLNSIILGVMQIFFIIFIIYQVKEGLAQSTSSIAIAIQSRYSSYGYLVCLIVLFMGGMQVPSEYLISIEGINISLIKSMPTHYNSWLKAKAFLSFLILVFFSLISSIIAIVMLNTDFYSTIVILAIPILYDSFISLIWLKINLLHPKFNWNNEQQLMKNSLLSIICLLGDILLCIVIFAILVGLSFINRYLACSLVILLLLIMNIVAYKILFNNVEKNINNMKLGI